MFCSRFKIEMHNLLVLLTTLALIPISSCSENSTSKKNVSKDKTSYIKEINSLDEFKKIIETSGDKLLVFDLYADWCTPCKILSPMIEKIASENREKAAFYKINVDKSPSIASNFEVSGIPYVVFVKNKKDVHAITGLQTKAVYLQVINQFSNSGKNEDTPDGELIEGVRVIIRNAAETLGDIFVYRGDKVKLIIENITSLHSIHIPQYNISQKVIAGEKIEVIFKAKDVGIFPVYYNGQGPSGDSSKVDQIIVMQYEPTGKAAFSELTAKQAEKLINEKHPLVLDVRTPNEYNKGHLENSKLIPLQQLEGRLSEIGQYKNKDILVYCRSGNRSTVASKILIDNGFTGLYNLKTGIKGWKKEEFKIIK